MHRNILAAYDDSEGARAALQSAAELATASGGSLTVVHSVTAAVGDSPLARRPGPDQVADERHLVERAIAGLDPGLEASPWIAGGPPGEAILAVAEEIGADLIVTGSRGRSRMARAVLGSVSTHLVQNAHCDVLVVHPRG
jgi:nucleotide-binding universal stress UspA family protein